MAGQMTKCSMRLWGEVVGHQARVLIDTGASHNFISPGLVQDEGLVVCPTSDFMVKVGNGQQVASKGKCLGVSIQIPELVTQDFYVFPVEGSKLVLGLAWLDTFGDVLANFRKSRLIIRQKG